MSFQYQAEGTKVWQSWKSDMGAVQSRLSHDLCGSVLVKVLLIFSVTVCHCV
jgi:hypothetical protein